MENGITVNVDLKENIFHRVKDIIDGIIDINCLECVHFDEDLMKSDCICEPVYDILLEQVQNFTDANKLKFGSMMSKHNSNADVIEEDIAGIWEELRKEYLGEEDE